MSRQALYGRDGQVLHYTALQTDCLTLRTLAIAGNQGRVIWQSPHRKAKG